MQNLTVTGTCTEVGTYIDQGGTGTAESWIRSDNLYRIAYNGMYWVLSTYNGSATEFEGLWPPTNGPTGTMTAVSGTGTCIVSLAVAVVLASELALIMDMF